MYKRLHEFLDKMDAFYSLQFCFRKKHSTNHASIILYNVCSLHQGMFSILWVFSTSGDTMSTLGVSWVHRGCSVHRGIPWAHWGDVMSTSGGYHDACGGISWVHQGMFSTSGGYHEYIEGISWVHWGMCSTSGFSLEIERFLPTCSPTCIMISPWCTEHPPMYSWYPPDVLMVSPNVLMVSPQCTEHPRCTHDMPWCTHGVPRCTEHPLMHWTHITWQKPFRVP